MNVQELKSVLPVLMKNKVVPFIWGQQGIGKTQTVKQVAKELNIGFVHLHLATQEVGDLVGLLIHAEDGTVKHSRPEWFPKEGRGVLFLDECNRAHPDVLQAMFSLVTEGTIHTHKLPEGWSVVAAGNYQSNMFNVTDTSDAAWMSRFCHIDFDPTREEFILFAEESGQTVIADFIRDQPELLEKRHKERLNGAMITPDRRSWLDMIGRLEGESTLESVRYEVYSGILGVTTAAAYMTYKKKATNKIRGRDILTSYEKVRSQVLSCSNKDEARFDLINAASDEILAHVVNKSLSDSEMDNFKQFLLDVPLEMGLKIINKLQDMQSWPQRHKILNDKDFVSIFKQNKLKQKGINGGKKESARP